MTHRRLIITIALITLIALLPTASAVWSATATVPASFRPNRTITMSYTATSASATDLPLDWQVHLWTCQDTNADGKCLPGDASVTDWTAKRLQANANSASSVTWSVSLASATGSYLAYFQVTCTSSPCVGQSPTGFDRSNTFQLAYTNTWTRTLTAPILAQDATTGTITYRLASTSVDDADITGSAELRTTPNGTSETSEGTRAISALANTQQTLTWTSIQYASVGRQQERVVDSTTPQQAFANTSVLDVHLHVSVPVTMLQAGGAASFYVTLEGHGTTPDPTPLGNTQVHLVVKNGTFNVANTILQTDGVGTAYATFQGAQDLTRVDWLANASLTWNGFAFAPTASGALNFTAAQTSRASDVALAANVSGIRDDLSNLSLHGVHLDELGTHNVLTEVGRVIVYAIGAFLLILLVVHIALRV